MKYVDNDNAVEPDLRSRSVSVLAQAAAFWRSHPEMAIFAIAMAVRVAFILAHGANAEPLKWGDDTEYDGIATRLATKHEYVNRWYPPGYPLFLTLFYVIFGRVLVSVRLAQSALGAATCVLTYRLGAKSFGETVGRIAGALLAVYPGHVYMSWRIMAETLFIFLLMLALDRAIRMAGQPTLRDALELGLIVGLGQLVKSNLYVLPALLVAWCALLLPVPPWRRFKLALGLAVSLLLLSLLTPVANFLSARDHMAPLPGNAGRTLWSANNPLANGYFIFAEKEPAGQFFIYTHGFEDRMLMADEFEKDRLFGRLAILWIRENPARFLTLSFKKLNNAFGLFPHAVTLEGSRATQAVHFFSYGLIAPLALAGMLVTRRRWRFLSTLYLTLLSYTLMVVIFYGTPRFTVIVMPILIVFASCALQICARQLSRILPLSNPPQFEIRRMRIAKHAIQFWPNTRSSSE